MSRDYGIDPQHCRCCMIGLRVARAVDRPRMDLASLSHCGCCRIAAAHLDHASRGHAQLVDQWRLELASWAHTHRLLVAALHLLPADLQLPADLETEWADYQRREAMRDEELAAITRQCDRLDSAITAILWEVDGGPADPVYNQYKIAGGRLGNDLTRDQILSALRKVQQAASKAGRPTTKRPQR